ncbi:hypothetical protein JTE90_000037 [Oedothorax gibbosus]|uniref:Uncharacterized protein n=1 Tax=Oedothorax gibbosus TaxID=931172 RepID=A0AAV6TQW4_9ARAC|nr:hypothetical protein JTE90_000037 [Oedothorax gibbosus]
MIRRLVCSVQCLHAALLIPSDGEFRALHFRDFGTICGSILTEEENTYSYFQQDGATAHSSQKTLNHIYKTFDSDRVVSRGQSGLGPLWPPRSPDLSVCDFFFVGNPQR